MDLPKTRLSEETKAVVQIIAKELVPYGIRLELCFEIPYDQGWQDKLFLFDDLPIYRALKDHENKVAQFWFQPERKETA